MTEPEAIILPERISDGTPGPLPPLPDSAYPPGAVRLPAVTEIGDEPGQSPVSISLLERVAGQQRRLVETLAEAAGLMHEMAKDADEMRAQMNAIRAGQE